ncbi:MAG: SMP-30/gluconolactonase/LRE family protein, partial [Calditrichaeota bacterium]
MWACNSGKHIENGHIHEMNDRLKSLISVDQPIEVLAEGFEWSEGVVWDKKNECLFFSDVPQNTIYRWDVENGLQMYLCPSGYGADDPNGVELGSNGLYFANENRQIICDSGLR